MNQVRTVVWKEIRQFAREPRLIAFLLFSPVAMTLLFGYALSLQVRNAPLAVFDEDRTYLSQAAKDALWRREEFVVSEARSMEEVRRRLASGEARIGLHIPPDFSAKLFAGRTPTLRFLADGSLPTVAVAMKSYAAKTLGAEFQRALRVERPDAERRPPPKDLVRIETTHLYNPSLEDRAFFLPGIAGILVLEVAVVLASSAIVREKERRTMEQLLVAPIGRAPLIAGKLAPYGVVAFLDFCVIALVVRGVFDVPFAGSPALLAALTTLYIAANLAIGLHISTLARTEQQAVFFCLFVMIPSILLSGFVFPVEAMPAYVRPLAAVLPLTHFLEIIRGVMLKGVGLAILWPQALALVAIAVAAGSAAMAGFGRRLDADV